MSQPISSQGGDHVTSEDQSERSTGCYDDLVSSHLCHCHCHHNHHPSHLSRVGELEVIFKPFYFWTDAFHTQVNTTSPALPHSKPYKSLLSEFQIAGVFKVKVPKMTSARCVESGCTFVCVCPAGHAGVQITLQNTTVLWAQIKRQSCLMCWSSGVSVAVAWSALFCLK